MENTLDIVKEMIAKKLEIDAATIKPESTLTDVGLDSLDTFDIIFDAEDKFGIKVPNDQVNVTTIQDVVNLFDKLLAEKTSASK
jgi:acyl carrier protein